MSNAKTILVVACVLLTCASPGWANLWTTPELFAPANDPDEQDWRAIFSPDNLEMYIYTERDGNFANANVYRATRTNPVAPWGAASPVAELNSPAHDHLYWISQDQTEAYMARHGNPVPGSFGDIYRTSRASRFEPWGAPQVVGELSGSSFDRMIHLSQDGLHAVFSSNRPGGGGGGIDFWKSSRSSTLDAWSAPVAVSELNTVAEERGAFLSPDGLTLYFCRLNQGIFAATRPSLTSPFGTPVNLGFSTEFIDPSLSNDGKTIFIARPNGSNFNYDVYSSTFIPEPTAACLLMVGLACLRRNRR